MSAIHYNVTPSGRIVTVRCPVCAAAFDGLVQTQDRDGAWSPDVAQTMNRLGWVVQREQLFCGKLCAHKSAFVKKQELAVEVVTVLPDVSYQRGRQAALQRAALVPPKGKTS